MDQRYATGKKPMSSIPGERARYLNHELDAPSRFENLENYRAELLQKLDELKDHLSRSCGVAEKPGPRMGTDIMTSPELNQAYSRNHASFVRERMTSSYGSYRSSSLSDLHFHRGHRHEFQSYPDDYQLEMARGPFEQPQPQYLHQPYHEIFVLNRDFHKHNCSCVHCLDKNLDLPVNPSFLYNQRSHHLPSNSGYLHHPFPLEYRLQGFTTELDFGNDGIHQNCSSKTKEAHRRRHMMLPFAGGAPFIACSSCFELLKLPREHISLAKRQQKLKCGACSSIILFELEKKASTVPVSGNFDHVVTEMDDCCGVVVEETGGHTCFDSNADSPADNRPNSVEFEKQLDPPSASSLSENLQMPNTLSSESAELNPAEVESFPHPTLSTEKCTDHSAKIVVEQRDSGAKGTKSEFNNNVSWQNSVKDSAVSTEIDMSSKEFQRSSVTVDSVDVIKEQRVRDEKGAESSSKGHAADFVIMADNVEVGSSQVFVNQQLIPEHLVQKAELLAGPIQPGDYWYDIRAGFWGVMGFPCLGIIMPYIQEFNYPMPVNCGAGNTEVFVNGRELHKKDFDLLVGRGLPKTRQKSYLITISGEVVDEDNGEELDSIGRLAPTVERAKHGFGLKVPSFIVRLQR